MAKATTGFNKPVKVSDALAQIVGKANTRPEITKKLWEYIKLKGLQDIDNKRNINPDDKLAKVLGSKAPIDMFKMTGAVSKHIS